MRILIGLLLVVLAGYSSPARAELFYLIVSGLGGDPTYAERFAGDTAAMQTAAERTLGDDSRIKVLSGEQATLEAVRAAFAELSESTVGSDRVAVFLIGHGSYDGREYKFNLTGPDITGTELVELFADLPATSQLIVNMTSASGAVLEDWAGNGRELITATRSGAERNATRFSEHWAASLSSEDADLDKNGSISVQEAFDFASRSVADSYEADGALATEHPEIRGDAAGAFEVARLTARVAQTPELEVLNARLAELEEDIAALRLRRDELGDDYLPQLQGLLVDLALVQEQIDEASAE